LDLLYNEIKSILKTSGDQYVGKDAIHHHDHGGKHEEVGTSH
jgi:hypothetical protein